MFKKILATSAIATLMSINVNADPITTWDVETATRFDPGSVLPGTVDVQTNQRLRWGVPVNDDQSGLDINDGAGIPDPAVQGFAGNQHAIIDTNDMAFTANHFTDQITHLNNVITNLDDALDSATIRSTLFLTPFTPAGTGLPSGTVDFDITFLETLNAGFIDDEGVRRCDDGALHGVGINSGGCSDIFVLSDDALDFPFQYPDLLPDGTIDPDGELRTYFFSLAETTNGFDSLSDEACIAAGAEIGCLGFQTAENQNTTFQFAAFIKTEEIGMPEPGTVALLGLAIAGLGFNRRAKKQQ